MERNTYTQEESSEEYVVSTNSDTINLSLSIREPLVVNYLRERESIGEEIEEKAIEAMKVGVIAIQSASPSLDTRVVEEAFREVQTSIDGCLDGFQEELRNKFDSYFKDESGTLPRSLESFLGENGAISSALNGYFNPESGKLHRILDSQIGQSSSFARSLDPTNKESIISKLEDSVESHLKVKTGEMLAEFSLDKDDSALSRFQKTIKEEIGSIHDSNQKFFNELREALGFQKGKTEESERGTEKGREFEVSLYDMVASLGRQLGDSTENVRSQIGSIPRCKTGDYVLTLGLDSGSPESRIVVEVTKEIGVKFKQAIDELKRAKENRKAEAGIYVFSKGVEPPEVGDFCLSGNDFFVTVEDEVELSESSLAFFAAAYRIARTMLVTSKRKEQASELDIERIKREVESTIKLTGRISEMITKARTINTNSLFIMTTAEELKGNLDEKLNEIQDLLNT